MKVDCTSSVALTQTGDAAARAERDGRAAIWFGETSHDPFSSISLAATATDRIELGTGVAIAFARSPMTMAVAANDAQLISGGRLLLGLGSQVKPHITRRFSMPWSHPAARMREYVLALRAIWRSWRHGERLDFAGEFYTHTLMTPFFDPGPNPFGPPPVLLAGVGELMTKVAGEVADGFICHGFTTERYLREVTLPALSAGRRSAGLSLEHFEISGVPFVVTGRTEEEMELVRQEVCGQIAFYASTAGYRAVLDRHGWGDLQGELNTLARNDRWNEMGRLIGDEILSAFAVVAEPDAVAPEIARRYGDIFTRVHLYGRPSLDPWTTQAIGAALAGL